MEKELEEILEQVDTFDLLDDWYVTEQMNSTEEMKDDYDY